MLRKFFKLFLTLFQIAVACLLIAAGAFFWRLHKAPIDITPYVPYLAQAASSTDIITGFSVENAQMRWGGIRHPVDFAFTGLKAFDDGGRLVLSVPKMSFSFSLAALARGTVAPRTIALYRPYLHWQIDPHGELRDTADGENAVSVKTLLSLLKNEKHLTEFSLVKAAVKITDALHGAEWNIPTADLTYSRRFRKNHLTGNVAVEMRDKRLMNVEIGGKWRGKGKKMTLSLNIDNLDLTASTAAQKYPYLKNFTTPVAVKIDTRLNAVPLMLGDCLSDWRKAVDAIDFTVTGGKGIVNLPAPVIARFDMKRFKINGSWHGAANNFDIDSFRLVVQNGGKAWGNFSVSGIGDALDSGDWEKVQATLNAEAVNIPVDMLPDYWPASIGPDVHGWVKRNLNGGMITGGQFALHFKGVKEGGIDADMVDGSVDITGTKVDYMDQMPSVADVSGNVKLARDKITITVAAGHTDSIAIANGGTLIFRDLTSPVSTADLNLNLTGGVRDILTVLDAPPLKLTTDMGLQAGKTTGTATGNLRLSFPLGDAFKGPDQIKIGAFADVRNADIGDIALGYGLQDAILKLNLKGRDLSLNGTALFNSATAKFDLTQTFDHTKETAADIRLHVDLNERARAALNLPVFSNPDAVRDVLPADLRLVLKNDKTGVLDLTGDLTQADIDIREIGWVKPPKTGGKAVFQMRMKNSKPQDIPLIRLSDDTGTDIRGSIAFARNGSLENIEIDPIRTEHTDAALRVAFKPDGGVAIDMTGAKLDLSGLIGRGTTFKSADTADEAAETPPEQERDIVINAAVDNIRLSKNGYAENNAFSAEYRSGWRKMDATGYVGEQKVPMILSLTPTGEKDKYAVSLTSKDAGYTLKALDYISSVKGGDFKLNGVYTSGVGSQGTLEISDFYLEEQQTLTRLLMLTSLTGIIDTLRGEGLFFDKAEIPYTTDDKNLTLTVKDAVIAGASLGVTMSGKYYRETGYMNLRGSLVPFYTINSLLGKIPLIGRIFSGEKGGGLIAPTYTIKGKLPSPDISVNGFSALAPGGVRSLFGALVDDIDDGDPTKAAADAAKNAAPVPPAPVTPRDPSREKEFTDILHHE